MTRPRFTIGRLMVGIAVVAGVFALVRSGTLVAIIASFALLIALLAWLPTRHSPRLAGRAFIVSSTWVNLSVVALYMLLPYLRGYLAVFVFFVSIPLIPTIAGFGLSWVECLTGWPAKTRALLITAALVAFPIWTIVSRWPFRLGFYISSPALERLAVRIEAGEKFHGPEWAGLYRVTATKRMFSGPDLGLVIASDNTGDSVFIRSATPPPPGIPNADEPLPTRPGSSGHWTFFDED